LAHGSATSAAPRARPEQRYHPAVALRVVFAEDDFLVREGTAALLEEIDGIELVATAKDLDSLMAAVEEHRPDAVLTDIRMPPTFTREGIEAAVRIRALHPSIGVVVLSHHLGSRYAFELLEDGASGRGYLLKERVADVDDLVQALSQVSRGGSVLDPKVVERLMSQEAPGSPVARLTDRERGVLEQMAQGKSNAAIMNALDLSERTVEKHINSVFGKLGLSQEPDVNRRVMAVLAFLRVAAHEGRD
jgi:DNA-binding NarL/FixJ family response regulator